MRGKYKFMKTINFNTQSTLDKLKQSPMLMNFKQNKSLESHNTKEITLSIFQRGEIFGFTDVILNQNRFSKCICRVANSVIYIMKREDFILFIYNTPIWKQKIDMQVNTQQNYRKVKMTSVQDISYKNKHYLMQIREIRGETD